jgi:hypothetical protein
MMRRIAIILCFIFFATQIRTAHAQESDDLTADLVAYWGLEEAAGVRYDAHGEYDLSDFNTVASTAGKIGNAATFENTNSEYLAYGPAFSALDGATEWTVAMWVQTNFFNYPLLAIDDLFVIKPGGNTPTEMGTVTFENGSYAEFQQFASSPNFRHTVIVYDNGDLKLYRHGELVTYLFQIVGTPPTAMGTGGALWLGYAGGADSWDGGLDEVGIWARALDADEVSALYNNGAGLAYADVLATAGSGVLEINVTDAAGAPFALDELGRMDPSGYESLCTHCASAITTLDNSEPVGYHGAYINMVITQAAMITYTIIPDAAIQLGLGSQPDYYVLWPYWVTGTHQVNLVLTPTAQITATGSAYPTLVAPPDLTDLGLTDPQEGQPVAGLSLAYAEGEVPPVAMRRATGQYQGIEGTLPNFAADYQIWLGHAEKVVRLINMGNALWILAAIGMAGLIVSWAVRELRSPK